MARAMGEEQGTQVHHAVARRETGVAREHPRPDTGAGRANRPAPYFRLGRRNPSFPWGFYAEQTWTFSAVILALVEVGS